MPDLIPRLRDALVAADYTVDAVTDLLGATAHAALGRHETTPALRATTGGSPIETLVRLWLLQTSAPAADVERALPGLLDDLCESGILERSAHEVAARVDLRPHATDQAGDRGGLWVASDLTPGLDGASQRLGADHVLGISPAATSLIELTVREPVARALDLGTGCGVQALHLARHVERVVATDVNPRALWLAGINAELNEVANVELREGSLFGPVADERFDLIVSNPPFVISPATGDRLVYRDSGVPGDGVVEQIVRAIPDHLAPGGLGQVLANWMVLRDQPWGDRLASWTDGSGCDVWVVQREELDPAAYVELWLKDAGLHGTHDYQARYDAWLSWFEEQDVAGIGFGWINLRASGGGSSRFEEWRWEVEQPLGPEVAAHFARTELLRDLSDDTLLATRPRLRSDVVQETHGAVGAEHPGRIVLRQQRGMRRARDVDTALAGLAGASDGDLTVGQLLAALDHLVGSESVAGTRLRGVRDLLADGFLGLEQTS